MRTPLAWKNLTYNPRRLAVAISGVGFAVVLIFMELGYLNALLESTVQVVRRLNGELFILSKAKYALPAMERFDKHRLDQAKGIAGVRSVSPFYMESLGAVLREHQSRGYPIRVLAFHERDDVMNLNELQSRPVGELLRGERSALVDVASRGKFGIPHRSADLARFEADLADKKISLVGQFRLGVDFANDGNLVMDAANFAQFFPNRAQGADPLSLVDLGVVKLEPGADPLAVQRDIQSALLPGVEVVTKEELIQREKNFWSSNAPVGYIFLVGVYMGFIVGVIICYQIIYSDIADHLKEFATLKAMGYPSAYFIRLVLIQTLFLSIMAFFPGLLISMAGYKSLTALTGLTMEMTVVLALIVLLVTMVMCAVSGLLAVRKLLAADPAELF